MHELFTKILADGFVIPVILVGVWVLVTKVPKNERYHAYSRILMAGLTALLTAKLIASVYQPEVARPFEELGVSAGAAFLNNPGFPSDHTLFCTAITLAVWFETDKKRVVYILAGLTLLVAVGRVVALVHTPLDVAGGILIAFLGVPWYLQRENHKLEKLVKDTRQEHKNRVQ
jgi:membrane-associated phospholipid phosphatase